tara:strand:+ start:1998 stop:2186 length:189 start_codon:yes stop_codon:yes gene_type:complete
MSDTKITGLTISETLASEYVKIGEDGAEGRVEETDKSDIEGELERLTTGNVYVGAVPVIVTL